MDYFLYPGCSLEASASHYLVSLNAVAKTLKINFNNINDWNCCGASISYIGGNELQSLTLNVRNLAIAESQAKYDIIAPCSSCYIMMNKTNHLLRNNSDLMNNLNAILSESGLIYSGKLKVRHILDVLYNDIGIKNIKKLVKKPLNKIKIAVYYGCQTTRPYGEYDSKEKPTKQDEILSALDAKVIEDYNKRVYCCGSGLFFTEMDYCIHLVKDIIESAYNSGADLISTACPMCQINLEMYQTRINNILGYNFKMPIVFFTQLIAIAFGLDRNYAAGLDRNIIPIEFI